MVNLSCRKSELSDAAHEFIRLVGRCLAEKWRLEQEEASADASHFQSESALRAATKSPENPGAIP